MDARITAAEVARILNISTVAVASLCRRGHFPGATCEPWGPGTRWLIPLSTVTARKKLKKAGKLPIGGNPNMIPGNDLWRLRKKNRKIRAKTQ